MNVVRKYFAYQTTRFLKILFICFISILFLFTNKRFPAGIRADRDGKIKYRSEVIKELVKIETAFKKSSNDRVLRKKYVVLLFQTGNFWDAKKILKPLVNRNTRDVKILLLAARLDYLTANYRQAEKTYKRVRDITENGSQKYDESIKGLALIYHQTLEYDKVKTLPIIEEFKPHMDLMKQFPGRPYNIKWSNKEKVAIIPFTEIMLPSFEITVNDKNLNFILDTGGDFFYIDKGVAEACGLEKLVERKKSYVYTEGEEVDEFLGRAESVVLGNVKIRNVPFVLAELKSYGVPWDGILTTQVLKRFLATVDYANKKIILRERSKHGKKQFKTSIEGKETEIIPFVLDDTHFMFVSGSINDKTGLNFFVDSGLAAPMPFIGIDEMIQDLKLETKVIEGTSRRTFNINSLGMGNLIINKPALGLAGILIHKNFYWRRGFIIDGLISHQFLKNFDSWTIDFDAMSYIFVK